MQESQNNQQIKIYQGDCREKLDAFDAGAFQAIIADPPYFQVLLGEEWDNQWQTEEDYLNWTEDWIKKCGRLLKPDGLFFIFGQLGKREHLWLHVCSMTTRILQFHDMLVWDRAVGYNERYDSFTPCYEMILVLRKDKDAKAYFNKDAVRVSYDEETIKQYLKDKRYKDLDARAKHLEKGKYATNILRVPSLKGSSKEKVGHPSQKPVKLIEMLVAASTREGDSVLDPFLGSGTTALVCQNLNRNFAGIEIEPKYIEIAKSRLEKPQADLFNQASITA
ncbi:MAG: site-specific DNA-methyltransferase [Acidobacteriota bacterium]|nr:site-specific DNA-methyltransferase [Acidobacteriota bacterium]